MRKNSKNLYWNMMPAGDRLYLRSAYKRYKHMFSASASNDLLRLDSFQEWLLKRGISKQPLH
jgi:hypothetical protein